MRMPVLLIIFLFVFSFLVDLYISVDVRKAWKKRGVVWYWISVAMCFAVLIVAISLPRRDTTSGIGAVMWLLYVFMTIYIGKLTYVLFSLVGRLIAVISRRKAVNLPFRIFGVAAGLGLMAIMWIGVGFTRRHIRVNNEDVYSQKIPESFDGYRIVQISDLHVGTWGNDDSFLRNLVDSVNNLHPDVIFFTGDIVNRTTDELLPFTEVLAGLKAKDGVYSVLGNHDYGDYVDWPSLEAKKANLDKLKQLQAQMGWKMLNNERVFLRRDRDSVMLIGVENWGEPPFVQYGDLEAALSSHSDSLHHQNDGSYKILLSHNPEHWNREVSKHTNIDLTLSGHTHAMQAMIKVGGWKWSLAKYRYDQWSGRYSRENESGYPTDIYVNIGAGEVGMPSRLMGAYPEITVLTLKKAD